MQRQFRLGLGAAFRRQNSLDGPVGLFAWLSATVPALQQYYCHGTLTDISINLLEAFAVVSAIVSFITDVLPNVSRYPASVVQVHVWSDNVSALSWLAGRRALSPFHGYIIQLLGHLLLQSGLVLTMGHIPGVENSLADAPSREFDCPSGPTIHAQLAPHPQLTISKRLLRDTIAISGSPSTSTSTVARAALTTAAHVTGRNSAIDGHSLPF